jgi:DNA-binding GntR family transcriptional regulator
VYRQAQDTVLEAIREGEFAPGDQLPPEEDLATSLGVSRHTLRRALGNLEMMGLIERSHGGGTFVAQRRPVVDIPLDTYESLHPHLASAMGYRSSMRDLVIDRQTAGPVTAERLGVSPGAPVTRVSFVVEVEDHPVAYFDIRTPESIVTARTMRAHFHESIVDFFDGCEGRPRVGWYRGEVREARAEGDLSRLLNVSEGRTLFLFDGELFDEEDRIIGLSMGYLVPECVRITVDRRAVVHEMTEPCP